MPPVPTAVISVVNPFFNLFPSQNISLLSSQLEREIKRCEEEGEGEREGEGEEEREDEEAIRGMEEKRKREKGGKSGESKGEEETVMDTQYLGSLCLESLLVRQER